MKKMVLLLTMSFVLLFGCSCGENANTITDNLNYPFVEKVSKLSDKEVTHNETNSVIALLLYSQIDDAIQNHFGEPTQFALYNAKVTDATQIGNSFSYTVTIAVPTFHGAHNPPYGLEILTFTISPAGITLESYRHIELDCFD